MCWRVMSPLALVVLSVCMLKGHMALQVINTWQHCCHAWRSVTRGTTQWQGIGSAAWDTVFYFLFDMQFRVSSYIPQRSGEQKWRRVCLWRSDTELHYRRSMCIYFPCRWAEYTECTCANVFQSKQDNLTVLIVAILHQVLVDRVRHLWLAVVPFHIHQQMVPFTLQHRETQQVSRRQTSFCLITTSQTSLLANSDAVWTHCFSDSHRLMPRRPAERLSQLKRDCRAFRALIKQTVGWLLLVEE